jgi:tRNA-Thr(GGU) m(6)t(6)A37 methyltransferase TsaA
VRDRPAEDPLTEGLDVAQSSRALEPPLCICIIMRATLRTVGCHVDQQRLEITPIGWVRSPLTVPEEAPKQGDEGAPDAWLALDAGVLEALDGIQAGDEVIVLTWLDRARRDVLRVHPRGDVSRPRQGVFSTRSPHRPNPIGLHRVEIKAIDGVRILVRNLEALNGTPIVDIKPVLEGVPDER